MGKASRKKKEKGNIYYFQFNGTIHKIIAETIEEAKKKVGDQYGTLYEDSVGTLRKGLSKEEQKEEDRSYKKAAARVFKKIYEQGALNTLREYMNEVKD